MPARDSLCRRVIRYAGGSFVMPTRDSLCPQQLCYAGGSFVMPTRDSLCRRQSCYADGRFVMPASCYAIRRKEIVMPMFDRITHAVADSAKLATLGDDVMPRMLSGRVGLGEANARVG